MDLILILMARAEQACWFELHSNMSARRHVNLLHNNMVAVRYSWEMAGCADLKKNGMLSNPFHTAGIADCVPRHVRWACRGRA